MTECHTIDKDVIAIDGKMLRRSYDKSRRCGAIHVISAFPTMSGVVLGQLITAEKSNEITAIPELLNLVDLKGRIVTTDAMGCQKDIAEKIRKNEGDYLLAIKGNQGKLYRALEEIFPVKCMNDPGLESFVTEDKSHGRYESRFHIVSDISDELIDFTFAWKDLKKIGMAVNFRSEITKSNKEPEISVSYYISSSNISAEKFASAIQGHWDVENKLHWRLDVAKNEDNCRIRRGDAAELFSGIRHIAINILSQNKEFKAELRRKMRRTAMYRKYLASVLPGCGVS